ncbi:NADH-quinone oxidoreductase subunit M [Streptomyces sp. HNM0575]|uniref:complex I subunit 4 family protein n=1 Tax=Streptomyces sp. HNM0575 TaxID=2716338 RepID=UPI00145EFF41|nr:NADH-quinone oxidoreductase subunit M [Streptomyces sp. HNM0575]NLU72490.1 NADH-quinone oxidoreductase subunit M [Streptomyces sp. HNM0575]
MQALLVAVVVLPLLGSAAALLPAPPGLKGRDPGQAVQRHGVTVTGAVLAASVVLALGFDTGRPGTMQAESDVEWIPSLGIHLHLGVDGVSLPLLVLTALLTFLCALHSYGTHVRTGPASAGGPDADQDAGPGRPAGAAAAPRDGGPQAFVALILLLEAGTLATFATLDLLLFFLAFETVLVPMYFLIARWGVADPRERAAAAWKFILYTLLGSVVMLLGLLLIGLKSGTFDMVALATDSHPGLSRTTQILAVLAIGAGLAVKTPMWPLHSWLPDAHTAAPTVGSVLLAGVLLKMGTYGFVRILLPVAPDGMRVFAPYLAALAVTGIVYGSLACLALARPGADGDLKRLIAYSSVGHMGFVLLGIATMTPTGVNGALFANIAHGLITGLLFFLVGALKERAGSTGLDALSGETGGALYGTAPRFGGLLAFAAVASLGLPGLAGFWGEMLALLGAYDPAGGLSRPAFITYMAIGGLGTLLTAAYMLVVVRRVCMGDPLEERGDADHRERWQLRDPEPGTSPRPESPGEHPAPATVRLPDVRGYEYAAWTPLVVLTVAAGLWPALLLGLTDPAVQNLLPGVAR